MTLTVPASADVRLKLPVKVVSVRGVPKLLAGGVPVTPLNVALARRRLDKGATPVSVDTYLRAARLYAEFCAHKGLALTEVTNAEFTSFKDALRSVPFRDRAGEVARLRGGERGGRTADLMLALLYSLAADVEDLYQVRFDWRRFEGVPLVTRRDWEYLIRLSARQKYFRRSHAIKWVMPRLVGLPDAQFVRLIRAAYERWGDVITPGDESHAVDPESRRGALFFRNVAILLVLRYAGARRSEVVCLRFEDVDARDSLIYLVTKGRGGEAGVRLPVMLLPHVRDFIAYYAARFRPVPAAGPGARPDLIFLSHSVRNYGEGLTPSSVRAILEALRDSLEPPWDMMVRPHLLRHSFAYELQRYGGPLAVTTNMRHRSLKSSEPYRAGPEVFADELMAHANRRLEELFALAGLSEELADE